MERNISVEKIFRRCEWRFCSIVFRNTVEIALISLSEYFVIDFRFFQGERELY